MKRLVIDALVCYRAQRAKDAQKFMVGAEMAKGTDREWTQLDRARQAYADCEAAHKELCSGTGGHNTNPEYPACDIMVEMLVKIIGNKAQEAYDRAEAAAEEAAIAKFHHDAYGG